jgi:hypothetical protein
MMIDDANFYCAVRGAENEKTISKILSLPGGRRRLQRIGQKQIQPDLQHGAFLQRRKARARYLNKRLEEVRKQREVKK